MSRSHTTEVSDLLKRSPLTWVMSCLFGLTFMAPQPARADWTYPGVQYSCNAQNHSFEIIPYEPTSEEPELPPALGFQPVNEHDPSITCALGDRVVHVRMEFIPANEHHCMALGMVVASSLTVQGIELLKDDSGGPFNFTCGRVEALKKIRVTLNGNELTLEECYEPGESWTIDSPKAHCERKRMNIDAVAIANAKLAHSLADAATQAARSATRLPPNNDLANVFGMYNGIPLCAHWKSAFGRHLLTQGPPPHGRIAGKADQRTDIHPANPQICDANTEPLCTASDDLMAGDRVEVGFICGPWAYIRSIPQTNLTRPTEGWVETNHLYDVDSLSTPNSPKSPLVVPSLVPPPSAPVRPDIVIWLAHQYRTIELDGSLNDGKWEPPTDLPAKIQHLLAAGIHVDETNDYGVTALLNTIEPNNVDIAQLLLKAGANPNLVRKRYPQERAQDQPTPLIAAVANYGNQLDPTLIRLLLEAGANPNYRSEGEYVNDPEDVDDPSSREQDLLSGVTALHVAAENGYLSICKLLLDHGADPRLPRSDGALPADIARDNVHKDVAVLIDSYASQPKAPAH